MYVIIYPSPNPDADLANRLVKHAPDNSNHDDVIRWENFPRYWTFVWEIHPVTGEFPS